MGVRAIVDFWIRRIDDSERRSTSSRETIDIE